MNPKTVAWKFLPVALMLVLFALFASAVWAGSFNGAPIFGNTVATGTNDATDGGANTLNSGEVTSLAAPDSNRYTIDDPWPSAYGSNNEYLEFLFNNPNIPAGSTISSVQVTLILQRACTGGGCGTSSLSGAKLQLWRQSTGNWNNVTIPTDRLPTTNGVDTLPITITATTEITSVNDANNLKIRFLATKNGSGNIRTVHNYVNLQINYNAPPASLATVDPLFAPATNDSPIFVDWDASDLDGSITSVVLWFKKESGGSWTTSGLPAQSGASGTFNFTPASGEGTYYFQTVATDNLGNAEPNPVPATVPDTSTIFDTTAPTSAATPPAGPINTPRLLSPGRAMAQLVALLPMA